MFRFLLAALLFLSMSLFSAGPVVHIYLAEKFFEVFPKYNELEKERFILGTLFPDIRYISQIDRTHTHDKNVTLEKVLEQKSPFVAGMKFHAWVDNVRDEYVLSHNAYSSLPNELTTEQKPSFLKLLEDELLLNQIDVEYYSKILERIDPEELQQRISENEIRLWHAFLVFFLKTSPKTTVTLLSLIDTKKGHPTREDMEKWMSLINPLIKSPFGAEHTHHLINDITQKMVEEKNQHYQSTVVEVEDGKHS